MKPLASSYRDPDGFVFEHDGKIYRLITSQYFADYTLLFDSGLYNDLSEKGLLISHKEVGTSEIVITANTSHKIILPEQIPFISYPYEWSFDMWKYAALLTLKIADESLQKGMILKDATPFNIQFYKGKPIFIDTLSFEKYEPGKPWVAYRQFCECFLGPLLLMHYNNPFAGKLFTIYPNGIPLDIIKSLLPSRSNWNLHVYLHIWLQAKTGKKTSHKGPSKGVLPKQKLIILLKGLTDFITRLTTKDSLCACNENNPGQQYLETKKKIFKNFVNETDFKTAIDLAASDGTFTLLLKDKANLIIAADADPNCINELYKQIRENKITNIVPLINDLTSPSPAIGWSNSERSSFTERLNGDLILAHNLVHQLAISANIPLPQIAESLSKAGKFLIIEFVPKSDESVMQMLANREDIFTAYDLHNFKEVFAKYFTVVKEEKIGITDRVLFLLKRN